MKSKFNDYAELIRRLDWSDNQRIVQYRFDPENVCIEYIEPQDDSWYGNIESSIDLNKDDVAVLIAFLQDALREMLNENKEAQDWG